MPKEILIPHSEIEDSQTITPVMERKFKEQGLDIHVNEVENIDDDDKAGVRRLRIKNTMYFMGMGIGEKTQPGHYVYDEKTRTFIRSSR